MQASIREIGRFAWGLTARGAAVLGLSIAIPGCSLLPSDGPNANEMLARASINKKADPKEVTRFALVGIDARIAADAEQFYLPTTGSVPAEFRGAGAFGLVGVGDVLRVTIWEAGDAGLFSRDRKGTDVTVRVDVDGTMALPYAGRFPVAGKRLSDIEAIIVSRLTG